MSLMTKITRCLRPTKVNTVIPDTNVDFCALDKVIRTLVKRSDPSRVSLILQVVGNGQNEHFRIKKAINTRYGVIRWTSEKYYSSHQALQYFSEESYALDI